MAIMKFREPNQVKWQGMRPGHNGTQIIGYKAIINNIADVYVATGVKVAEITYMGLSANSGANAGIATLQLWDDGPAYLNTLMIIQLPVTSFEHLAVGLPYPVELLEDWSVRVYSGAALLDARGCVLGWAE